MMRPCLASKSRTTQTISEITDGGRGGGVQWWLDQDNFHCNLNVLIFIIQYQRLKVDFVDSYRLKDLLDTQKVYRIQKNFTHNIF